MGFSLTSPSFNEGGKIPPEHTCEGVDVSPELTWSGSPKNVRSFALIVDDPDAPAGDWVHWVIYNIPAQKHSLGEGIGDDETLDDGSRQGINDFGNIGYGGPCPPPGKPHRYYFTLYALDCTLNLGAKATKKDVESASKGHVLEKTRLMGTYQRK
jgi:Raf kinase inhibitor-like YbhB/YbcL family protein